MRGWTDLAGEAQAALNTHFWDGEARLYRVCLPPRLVRPEDPFHYWWQAHALDTLVDAYVREGDGAHLTRAAELVEGVRRGNHGSLHNDYYDDMLWMALALLRLHRATSDPRFLDDSLSLWEDIRGGWNGHEGGGVAWRKTQLDYKNTPANAPAVILGARLYEQTGEKEHLDFALEVLHWLQAHLIDPATGEVWDGVGREEPGRIDRDWAFTYNEGTVIGAGVAVWRATGDGAALDLARRTAVAAMKRYGPVLLAEGEGDGGLFKGILVRYLGLLAREDAGSVAELEAFLSENAAVAARHLSPAYHLNGPNWTAEPTLPLDLSAALSGVMLLESAAAVERAASRVRA
ncbi:glycoside hydrolase family 76 protein [Deinococcus apachensis]|uniref:glycoside hydrolase family 76 protein n=1 Tax=Deinococcus apachensis TaxID=309886 RepID=UPI0003700217|nr:glycoside hydrolase family 76 protein [Deinococcus apachensis]